MMPGRKQRSHRQGLPVRRWRRSLRCGCWRPRWWRWRWRWLLAGLLLARPVPRPCAAPVRDHADAAARPAHRAAGVRRRRPAADRPAALSDPRWRGPTRACTGSSTRSSAPADAQGVLRSRSLWDDRLRPAPDALADGAGACARGTGPAGMRRCCWWSARCAGRRAAGALAPGRGADLQRDLAGRRPLQRRAGAVAGWCWACCWRWRRWRRWPWAWRRCARCSARCARARGARAACRAAFRPRCSR
jgi:hypothetical protein